MPHCGAFDRVCLLYLVTARLEARRGAELVLSAPLLNILTPHLDIFPPRSKGRWTYACLLS